jgi:hypothetical protein
VAPGEMAKIKWGAQREVEAGLRNVSNLALEYMVKFHISSYIGVASIPNM